MTAWLDFTNFEVGQLLGSADANLIQDNIEFLRNPAVYFYQRSFGDADYTTASTTFTPIDGTNMNVELQTYGNPVRIELHCRLTHSTTGTVYLEFIVDGSIVSNDATNGLWSNRIDIVQGCDMSRRVSLSPGLHTFSVQWRTSAGTATMQVESNVQFEVHEEY